jgi:hypothetical protein
MAQQTPAQREQVRAPAGMCKHTACCSWGSPQSCSARVSVVGGAAEAADVEWSLDARMHACVQLSWSLQMSSGGCRLGVVSQHEHACTHACARRCGRCSRAQAAGAGWAHSARMHGVRAGAAAAAGRCRQLVAAGAPGLGDLPGGQRAVHEHGRAGVRLRAQRAHPRAAAHARRCALSSALPSLGAPTAPLQQLQHQAHALIARMLSRH